MSQEQINYNEQYCLNNSAQSAISSKILETRSFASPQLIQTAQELKNSGYSIDQNFIDDCRNTMKSPDGRNCYKHRGLTNQVSSIISKPFDSQLSKMNNDIIHYFDKVGSTHEGYEKLKEQKEFVDKYL